MRRVPPLVLIGGRQYAQACGELFDDVQSGRLAHLGQPPLDDAVAGARRRQLGDAWTWSRSRSVDVGSGAADRGDPGAPRLRDRAADEAVDRLSSSGPPLRAYRRGMVRAWMAGFDGIARWWLAGERLRAEAPPADDADPVGLAIARAIEDRIASFTWPTRWQLPAVARAVDLLCSQAAALPPVVLFDGLPMDPQPRLVTPADAVGRRDAPRLRVRDRCTACWPARTVAAMPTG